MKTADNLALYLFHTVLLKYDTKYVYLKYAFNKPDSELKKYVDIMGIIDDALLQMRIGGEYH